jgi:hypothetical protein
VEEPFDAVEDVNELVLAGAGIFGRLRISGIKIGCVRKLRSSLTEKRTPISAKSIVASGKA